MPRVLIVDDSVFMRKAIRSMLAGDPQVEIVGEGRNGKEGLELARRLRPDVITLDIEMPEMDGLACLRRIMSECPTHVIMVSSLTTEGSHAALTALRYGAADIFAKDSSIVSTTLTAIKDELLERVHALSASRKPAAASRGAGTEAKPPHFRPGQFDLICVGSSTGGPPVLEKIVTDLPADLSAPMIIAQHMPEVFTRSMAERFSQTAQIRVLHVQDGMMIEARTVYICPGGQNTHVRRAGAGRWVMRVDREPAQTVYFPSADALFASAAEVCGARTLCVVLTGMGEDGLHGARQVRDKGGIILAQNEESCVVYGMPKAVTVNGLTAASLTPEGLTASLRSLGGVVATERKAG